MNRKHDPEREARDAAVVGNERDGRKETPQPAADAVPDAQPDLTKEKP